MDLSMHALHYLITKCVIGPENQHGGHGFTGGAFKTMFQNSKQLCGYLRNIKRTTSVQ